MKKKPILSALGLLTLFLSLSPAALALSPGDMVVPVGETVGVELRCTGVIVSGLAELPAGDGSASPAGEAGVRAGDRITGFNGQPVRSGEEFLQLTAEMDGGPVELEICRGEDTRRVLVTPVRGEGGRWQLGLWLRDGVRGIGTVTFWDPASQMFGALGHGVSMPQSQELLPAESGEITRSEVTNVIPGKQGFAGELLGETDYDAILGRVERNDLRGIFGTSAALGEKKPVPLAADREIRPGPATILATVDRSGPREFAAEITRIDRDGSPTRQLTITVTDPALLSLTGGIVQGMSGSPVLQNGRLVGAVTHVLLSDPTKGYGITMENMLKALPAPGAAA